MMQNGISEDYLKYILKLARKCYEVAESRGHDPEFCKKMWMIGWCCNVSTEFSFDYEVCGQEQGSVELCTTLLDYYHNNTSNSLQAIRFNGKSVECETEEWIILNMATILTKMDDCNFSIQEMLDTVEMNFGFNSTQYFVTYYIVTKYIQPWLDKQTVENHDVLDSCVLDTKTASDCSIDDCFDDFDEDCDDYEDNDHSIDDNEQIETDESSSEYDGITYALDLMSDLVNKTFIIKELSNRGFYKLIENDWKYSDLDTDLCNNNSYAISYTRMKDALDEDGITISIGTLRIEHDNLVFAPSIIDLNFFETYQQSFRMMASVSKVICKFIQEFKTEFPIVLVSHDVYNACEHDSKMAQNLYKLLNDVYDKGDDVIDYFIDREMIEQAKNIITIASPKTKVKYSECIKD